MESEPKSRVSTFSLESCDVPYSIIDPIIISLGPLAIRWYGLSYLAGFAVVWWLGRLRAKTSSGNWSDADISDLVFFGAMGAVVGGRIGYVLFYNMATFFGRPALSLSLVGRGHVISWRVERGRGRALAVCTQN